MVLYSYNAQDENDLSVERGQCVTVLNSDDPDWFWVSKFDGQEGFVPSGFIYPLDAILSGKDLLPIQWSAYSPFDFSKKTVLGNVTVSRIFMYNSKNQIDKYLLA